MATASQVVECDYVGIASGNKDENKLAKTKWETTKCENINAPMFRQLPLTMECKLISYDNESCRLDGKIVNVSADESVLDEAGKLDVKKLAPIVFNPFNNEYLVIGEKVGNAFKDGTKLR